MRYRLETSCMDSSWKNSRHVFFFFFLGGGGELSPLVKLRPFEKIEMKFCKCHISKSIKDRNLKLVSAERMMREVFGEILEKNFLIIFELLPFFDILDIANAISRKV